MINRQEFRGNSGDSAINWGSQEGRGAKYCDQRVCMFVCLLKNHNMSTLHEILGTCIRTSGFVDDVMFHIMGRYRYRLGDVSDAENYSP